MGAPADESFDIDDGMVSWKSTLEQGEAEAGGYYVANDGTPEQRAHMARALLASESGQLDLLPAGRASINKALDKAVSYEGGSISVGKRADFVLLAGKPLDAISAVRRPVAVFKGDRWFDPALLYEAVGIRPFTR